MVQRPPSLVPFLTLKIPKRKGFWPKAKKAGFLAVCRPFFGRRPKTPSVVPEEKRAKNPDATKTFAKNRGFGQKSRRERLVTAKPSPVGVFGQNGFLAKKLKIVAKQFLLNEFFWPFFKNEKSKKF